MVYFPTAFLQQGREGTKKSRILKIKVLGIFALCAFIDFGKVFHHRFERLVEDKGSGEDVAGFLTVIHNAGVDGEVGAASQHVKAFLPVFGAATGAFGGDDHGHAAVLVSVEQVRGAFDNASGVPAVYGQASETFEQTADRQMNCAMKDDKDPMKRL